MNDRSSPDRLKAFLSIPPTSRDDRGQPIRPREQEMLGSLESRILGGRRPFARLLVFVPLAIYLGFLLFRFRSSGIPGMLASPVLWIVIIVTAFSLLHTFMRKAGASPTSAAVSATSAALGHCGACGYDLNTLHPADDGCVQCPECGAAWHMQRRTHTGLDREKLAAIVKKIPLHQKGNSAIAISDDRGVRLFTGYSWPRPTFSQRLPASAEPAVALYRQSRRVLRLWSFGIALAAWFAIVMLTAFAGAQLADVFYVGMSVAIVLAVVALLVSLVSLPARKVRTLALRAARCPECYAPLDRSLVCFDGCTICGSCRAAWRASDIPSTPPCGADSPACTPSQSSSSGPSETPPPPDAQQSGR